MGYCQRVPLLVPRRYTDHMFKLKGYRALVTGASSGIGKATAEALSSLGAEVIVAARREAKLHQVAQHIGGKAIVADLSQPDDIARLLEEAGAVDILVSNAGGPPAGLATGVSEEQWQAGYDLTFLSTVRLCQGVLSGMRERKWGRIIAITSQTVGRPSLQLPVSNAMRAAVTNYLRTLALEVAPDSVTCNTVAPGLTATERLHKLYPDPQQQAELQRAVPARRFGSPSEVAAAIAFLATDEAGYITGQELLVDGGNNI